MDVRADIRADVLAQKLSPHRSESRKVKFFAQTSLTRRRERPWPEGSQKNFLQENFGLIVRSLPSASAQDVGWGFREQFPPPLKMGLSLWVQEWINSGLWSTKVGENGSRTHLGTLTKTIFNPLEGGWILFSAEGRGSLEQA